MKKTKKVITDTSLSVLELSNQFAKLGQTANRTVESFNEYLQANYSMWKNHFKPQSQSITWIAPLIGLLFGIGVIIYFLSEFEIKSKLCQKTILALF